MQLQNIDRVNEIAKEIANRQQLLSELNQDNVEVRIYQGHASSMDVPVWPDSTHECKQLAEDFVTAIKTFNTAAIATLTTELATL